jgi:hypothetical protein
MRTVPRTEAAWRVDRFYTPLPPRLASVSLVSDFAADCGSGLCRAYRNKCKSQFVVRAQQQPRVEW